MTAPTDPCQLLPWDTDFFGVRTARVLGDTLDPARIEAIDAWRREHDVHWLYFLARADDPQTTHLAEATGFRLTDVRLTFEHKLSTSPAMPPTIRPFADPDLPALQGIARSSYTDTRFYQDGHVPRDLCDTLYQLWTVQSCHGAADRVYVAEEAGAAVGYVTCDLDRDGNRGSIGLIGVAEGHRGRGVGRLLVQAALAWAAGRNLPSLSVVTQARNLAAQRLYQRTGFVTAAVGLWFHRWYD